MVVSILCFLGLPFREQQDTLTLEICIFFYYYLNNLSLADLSPDVSQQKRIQ